MEVYLSLTLLGAGYMFNRMKKSKPVPDTLSDQANTRASQNNIYASKYVDKALNIERKYLDKHIIQQANVAVRRKQIDQPNPTSDLPEFTHNNMQPFFRGNVKQNLDPELNVSRLEHFGVNSDSSFNRKKQEVQPFFKLQENVNNSIYPLDEARDRMYVSQIQTNILPFEQIKVGPGITGKPDSKPTGGFQQDFDRSLLNIKTVDDLRIKTNPKSTGIEGRIVDGIKEKKLGTVGKTTKEKRNIVTENKTKDSWFKTTGNYLKKTVYGTVDAKPTARQTTSKQYTGNAFLAKATENRPKMKVPARPVLKASSIANPVATTKRDQQKEDYGKASIQIYSNERDVTSVKTYTGNLTTLVKSIISPVQDIMKHNKKELLIVNPRETGQVAVQIPSKQTVKDPNDVMRTTIKETTIHGSQLLNIKGTKKIPVYDPNVVARTTIKETLLQSAELLNLKNVGAKGIAREPNDKTKPTIRETLGDAETHVNIATHTFRGGVDLPDVPKTTIKETLEQGDNIGNYEQSRTGTGAYTNLENTLEIKERMGESYAEDTYIGTATLGDGNAYQNANYEARETMKENQEEYFGGAADQSSKKQMSNDANISISDMKESTLVVDREPTQQKTKVASGLGEMGDVDIKRSNLETNYIEKQSTKVINTFNGVNSSLFTKTKQEYEFDNRNEMEILEPFKKNNFTQPLDSFA